MSKRQKSKGTFLSFCSKCLIYIFLVLLKFTQKQANLKVDQLPYWFIIKVSIVELMNYRFLHSYLIFGISDAARVPRWHLTWVIFLRRETDLRISSFESWMIGRGEEWKITGHATTCKQQCSHGSDVLKGCPGRDSLQDRMSHRNVSPAEENEKRKERRRDYIRSLNLDVYLDVHNV